MLHKGNISCCQIAAFNEVTSCLVCICMVCIWIATQYVRRCALLPGMVIAFVIMIIMLSP
jgi:hypothetical protein